MTRVRPRAVIGAADRTARGSKRARATGDRGRRRSRRGRWRWVPTIIGVLVALVVAASRGGRDRATAAVNPTSKVSTTVPQLPWTYSNPLGAMKNLRPGRIDMGVDYAGSGPVLALGDGTVMTASNQDLGPPSCYGRTCWPIGGIVVYRLSDGPFAGDYIYAAENITVKVRAGQTVASGQPVAVAHDASPHIETGWASGKGPETLAIADRHQCPRGDPGGWSTIEGRSFNHLLMALGAPSGYLQPKRPRQRMPSGWATWPESKRATTATPRSPAPLSDGATAPSVRSQVQITTP